MVSKARLDFPEPERPVTTTSLSRGISTEMFLRLWTRAPCTAMLVRAALRDKLPCTALELIGLVLQMHEGQFLDQDVASRRQVYRQGDLADQAAVGQVLAGSGDASNVQI